MPKEIDVTTKNTVGFANFSNNTHVIYTTASMGKFLYKLGKRFLPAQGVGENAVAYQLRLENLLKGSVDRLYEDIIGPNDKCGLGIDPAGENAKAIRAYLDSLKQAPIHPDHDKATFFEDNKDIVVTFALYKVVALVYMTIIKSEPVKEKQERLQSLYNCLLGFARQRGGGGLLTCNTGVRHELLNLLTFDQDYAFIGPIKDYLQLLVRQIVQEILKSLANKKEQLIILKSWIKRDPEQLAIVKQFLDKNEKIIEEQVRSFLVRYGINPGWKGVADLTRQSVEELKEMPLPIDHELHPRAKLVVDILSLVSMAGSDVVYTHRNAAVAKAQRMVNEAESLDKIEGKLHEFLQNFWVVEEAYQTVVREKAYFRNQPEFLVFSQLERYCQEFFNTFPNYEHVIMLRISQLRDDCKPKLQALVGTQQLIDDFLSMLSSSSHPGKKAKIWQMFVTGEEKNLLSDEKIGEIKDKLVRFGDRELDIDINDLSKMLVQAFFVSPINWSESFASVLEAYIIPFLKKNASLSAEDFEHKALLCYKNCVSALQFLLALHKRNIVPAPDSSERLSVAVSSPTDILQASTFPILPNLVGIRGEPMCGQFSQAIQVLQCAHDLRDSDLIEIMGYPDFFSAATRASFVVYVMQKNPTTLIAHLSLPINRQNFFRFLKSIIRDGKDFYQIVNMLKTKAGGGDFISECLKDAAFLPVIFHTLEDFLRVMSILPKCVEKDNLIIMYKKDNYALLKQKLYEMIEAVHEGERVFLFARIFQIFPVEQELITQFCRNDALLSVVIATVSDFIYLINNSPAAVKSEFVNEFAKNDYALLKSMISAIESNKQVRLMPDNVIVSARYIAFLKIYRTLPAGDKRGGFINECFKDDGMLRNIFGTVAEVRHFIANPVNEGAKGKLIDEFAKNGYALLKNMISAIESHKQGRLKPDNIIVSARCYAFLEIYEALPTGAIREGFINECFKDDCVLLSAIINIYSDIDTIARYLGADDKVKFDSYRRGFEFLKNVLIKNELVDLDGILADKIFVDKHGFLFDYKVRQSAVELFVNRCDNFASLKKVIKSYWQVQNRIVIDEKFFSKYPGFKDNFFKACAKDFAFLQKMLDSFMSLTLGDYRKYSLVFFEWLIKTFFHDNVDEAVGFIKIAVNSEKFSQFIYSNKVSYEDMERQRLVFGIGHGVDGTQSSASLVANIDSNKLLKVLLEQGVNNFSFLQGMIYDVGDLFFLIDKFLPGRVAEDVIKRFTDKCVQDLNFLTEIIHSVADLLCLIEKSSSFRCEAIIDSLFDFCRGHRDWLKSIIHSIPELDYVVTKLLKGEPIIASFLDECFEDESLLRRVIFSPSSFDSGGNCFIKVGVLSSFIDKFKQNISSLMGIANSVKDFCYITDFLFQGQLEAQQCFSNKFASSYSNVKRIVHDVADFYLFVKKVENVVNKSKITSLEKHFYGDTAFLHSLIKSLGDFRCIFEEHGSNVAQKTKKLFFKQNGVSTMFFRKIIHSVSDFIYLEKNWFSHNDFSGFFIRCSLESFVEIIQSHLDFESIVKEVLERFGDEKNKFIQIFRKKCLFDLVFFRKIVSDLSDLEYFIGVLFKTKLVPPIIRVSKITFDAFIIECVRDPIFLSRIIKNSDDFVRFINILAENKAPKSEELRNFIIECAKDGVFLKSIMLSAKDFQKIYSALQTVSVAQVFAANILVNDYSFLKDMKLFEAEFKQIVDMLSVGASDEPVEQQVEEGAKRSGVSSSATAVLPVGAVSQKRSDGKSDGMDRAAPAAKKQELSSVGSPEFDGDLIHEDFDEEFEDGTSSDTDAVPMKKQKFESVVGVVGTFFVGRKLGAMRMDLAVSKTKGEGNCAFHAALGELNAGYEYECKDVDSKRSKLADHIRRSGISSDPSISPLIKQAIQELVMSGTQTCGSNIQAIIGAYKKHLQENEQKLEQAWIELSKELVANGHIREFIESSDKGHTFKEKFQFRLSEENMQIKAQILSVPRIQAALDRYNEISSAGFNWDMSNPKVVDDYANFIAKSRQWLLPCEIAIIAYVFKKTIHYFTTDGRGEVACVGTYNSGQQESVNVVFNGRDHYERRDDLRSSEPPRALM